MIKKIQNNEYLKRIDNMTANEYSDYFERVREWFRAYRKEMTELSKQPLARFQNVIEGSILWNDADCHAWEEGVRLLSALIPSGKTWLPDMLYTKSANRCIKQMVEQLTEAYNTYIDRMRRNVKSKKPNVNIVSLQKENTNTATVANADVPVRPKHIDQYVHLLPEKTQKRAAQVRTLLREMDTSREQLRLLIDASQSSAADRESWAKNITNIDNKVRSIYQELDTEWGKLVKMGVVTIDDLGMVHVVVQEQGNEAKQNSDEQKTYEQTNVSNEELCDYNEKQDSNISAERQVATLRRWLIDTRKKGSQIHDQKWVTKYREMKAIGGEDTVTDKVREAAKYYGIFISESKS